MMQDKGLNNSVLKQQNRGLLLKLIATGECSSRIELAQRTGLSKMAVSNLLGDFVGDEIIEEKESLPMEGKGRRPIQLNISPKAPKLIGIHLGQRSCRVVLCDLQLNILDFSGFKLTAETSAHWFSLLCQSIDDLLEVAKGERIYGIGIGSLGPIDRNHGTILAPPDFYGLHDLAIVSMLEEKYHMPVSLEGQYDCAALAEKYYGNGKDADDFFFVGIADSIGSGLVIHGDLVPNHNGCTSELGHISIDWQGIPCRCGKHGCLEAYASSRIIVDKLQALTGEELSFWEFCELAEQGGDAFVEAAFQDMMEKLAYGLANATSMFHPQSIIIGHDGYWIPDRFLQILEDRINTQQIYGNCRHTTVAKPHFLAETHIHGCACSLLREIFSGRLLDATSPLR